MIDYVRRNPVVVNDILKYAATIAVLYGVPVPPGVDVAIAGLIFGLLTLITKNKVSPVKPTGYEYVGKHRA